MPGIITTAKANKNPATKEDKNVVNTRIGLNNSIAPPYFKRIILPVFV